MRQYVVAAALAFSLTIQSFGSSASLDGALSALEADDINGALGLIAEAIDVNPEDQDLLAVGATIALEAGVPDLATQFLIQAADAAVMTGDLAALAVANTKIDEVLNLLPLEYAMASETAGLVDAEFRDAVLAYQEMSMAAQEALAAGELDAALEAYESALLVVAETLGEEHLFSILARRDLAEVFMTMGVAEKAEHSYGEALGMAQALLGEDHPQTIEIQLGMAGLYTAFGLLEEAALLQEMAVATLSAALPPGHELTLSAQFGQISTLRQVGAYEQAAAMLQEVCATVEDSRGQHHPYVGVCLQEQAILFTDLGRLLEAEAAWNAVLNHIGVTRPGSSADGLNALAQLSEVLRLLGRYAEARELLSGVVMAATQMGDNESLQLARSYLGRVFRDEGKLARALTVTESVLDYGLDNWQQRPLEILNTLLELGAVYQVMGRLTDAEGVFEDALAGFHDVLGPDHPSTLVALSNLGQIYEKEGLFDEAEPLLKQAVAQFEAIYGTEHTESARARSNLALLHESQGNFREAEPLYVRTLALLESSLGPEHTETIAIRNNLAFLYFLMEQFEDAEAMFTTVHDQWLRQFGADHQNTLKAANNLARVQRRLGKLVEAEGLMLDTLTRRTAALGEDHLDVVRSTIDLGDLYIDLDRLAEAEEILTMALERAEYLLGEQHPYTFDAVNALARVKEAAGKTDEAIEVRGLGFQRRSEYFDRLLWVTGENAREGYLRLHRPEFNDYVSLIAESAGDIAGKRLIEVALKRKGLLLKVTSEVQQIAQLSNDPKLAATTVELEAARKELASMTLSGPTPETKGRHTEVLYELEQKVNELQGLLGRASVRYRSSIANVSADAVEAVLKTRDSAFIDFLTYEDDGVPKLIAGVMVSEEGEVSYHTVVYPDRGELEDAVIEYRSYIQDDGADDDEILEIGQIAHELVWEPVLEVIGNIEYVYLVPDGILNILPFSALVDVDESYVIETHDLHILTSGRDLLPNEYRLADGEYVIVAGPNYDFEDVVSDDQIEAARRSTASQLGIRSGAGGLRGLNFEPLPGAEQEGRIIADRVAEQEQDQQMYFQDEAQEAILAQLAAPPQLLHIATHGFFLEADHNLRKRLLKLQRGADLHVPPPGDNPMLRAGLAFAGINSNAEFLGDIDTVNDGVLTAIEVLGLNLTGTRLVVLSACETGVGEIHEGEGVYGLRRSFQEAGVAEVISSLWEVSDAGTQALMKEFYERLLNGQSAREALRETQLAMMDSLEWGYPYIWSAFMIVGSYESSGYSIE